MLAHEPQDAAPVPEGSARQQPVVDLGRVALRDHGSRDVPALPACLRRAVTELDVLAVEAEALVEAPELVKPLATEKEERAQHPVCGDRLARALVQQVVAA